MVLLQATTKQKRAEITLNYYTKTYTHHIVVVVLLHTTTFAAGYRSFVANRDSLVLWYVISQKNTLFLQEG